MAYPKTPALAGSQAVVQAVVQAGPHAGADAAVAGPGSWWTGRRLALLLELTEP